MNKRLALLAAGIAVVALVALVLMATGNRFTEGPPSTAPGNRATELAQQIPDTPKVAATGTASDTAIQPLEKSTSSNAAPAAPVTSLFSRLMGKHLSNAPNGERQHSALTVTVKDWRGQPAKDATVTLFLERGKRSIQTDAQGTAVFDSPTTRPLRVQALNPNGIAQTSLEDWETTASKSLVLTLKNNAAIRGRVTDSDGNPIKGVTVVALAANQFTRVWTGTEVRTVATGHFPAVAATVASGQSTSFAYPAAAEGSGVAATSTTDSEGGYALTPPIAGNLEVTLVATATSNVVPPQPRSVHLSPDKDITAVDFTAEKAEILEGTVLNPKREPVEGAVVSGMMRGGTSRSLTSRLAARSGPDGRFILPGIPPKTLLSYVWATHPHYDRGEYRDVDPLAGPLEIVLRNNCKAVLVAVDGETHAPVPSYEFRILRQTYAGLDLDITGSGSRTVNDPSGEVSLEGFEGRELVAQAIELGPGGTPTGRRGAVRFNVKPSAEATRVELPILPDKHLLGIVVAADGSTPVPSVFVGEEPMRDSWGHATIPLNPKFDPANAQTGPDGRFDLGPFFPGHYTLVVEKKGLKPSEPVTVDIPEQGQPADMTIALDAQGVIRGRVAYTNGNPFSGIAVRYRGFVDGSVHNPSGEMKTDAQGNYRFENLQQGQYWVMLQEGAAAQEESKKVIELAASEEKVVDFDLTPPIRLEGTITLGGKTPADSGVGWIQLHLLPANGGKRIPMNVKRDGAYEVTVRPGDYVVTAGRMSGMWWIEAVDEFSGGVFGHVTVEPDPDVQYKDFDFSLTSAQIILEVPDGDTFQRGYVEISQKIGDTVRRRLLLIGLTGPTAEIPMIPPGQYKAEFRSKDGSWTGESAWETVEAGKDNKIVILKSTPNQARIGGWTSDLFVTDEATLDFDVTPLIRAPGTYRVIFQYEKGYHGLQIDGVTMLQNGSPIATDVHPGWTGAAQAGATYILQVPQLTPGARYSIGAQTRAKAHGDSNGSVYLISPNTE